MTAVLLLYLLATLDAAFSGYRAAGGRNALIRKFAYLAKAQIRGLAWGQAGVAFTAAFVVALVTTDADPPGLAADLLEGCRRLLTVYLPYSLVFLVSLVLLLVPSVDVRSILNVLVFGPFTLLRPVVGLAGVAWAFLGVPRWQVIAVGGVGLAAMLAVEWALDRWYGYRSRQANLLPSTLL